MIVGAVSLLTLFILLIVVMCVGGQDANKPKHTEEGFAGIDEPKEGHIKFLNVHPLTGHV